MVHKKNIFLVAALLVSNSASVANATPSPLPIAPSTQSGEVGNRGAKVQSVLPDFDVPKIDFSAINNQKQQIQAALKSIDFDSKGRVDALSVCIPEYKQAHQNLVDQSKATLSAYISGLDQIEKDAKSGSEAIQKLQGTYSSRVVALQDTAKKYPDSADTLNKTVKIEKQRMKADLDKQYNYVIGGLQSQYEQIMIDAMYGSKKVDVHKPNAMDAIAHGAAQGLSATTAALLWAMPTPFPVFLSPQAFHNANKNGGRAWSDEGDYMKDVFSTGWNGGGFWGIMKKTHDKSNARYGAEQGKYGSAVANATALFSGCKTAACVFEIEKDYKAVFKEIASLDDKPLKVGGAKLTPETDVRFSRIKKVLHDAANKVADGLPTAVFSSSDCGGKSASDNNEAKSVVTPSTEQRNPSGQGSTADGGN